MAAPANGRLTVADVGALIDARFTTDLFRLETRDVLDVPGDDGVVRDYLAGAPAPAHPWADVVRGEVADGKITRRVLALTEPLTDYRRMSIEWQYLRNVEAGERCRVVDRGARDVAELVGGQDFWLIEHRDVLLMNYDPAGRFTDAELVTDPDRAQHWQGIARQAWSLGADLTDWWASHPQYQRGAEHDRRVPTPRSTDDPQGNRTDDAAREGVARAS